MVVPQEFKLPNDRAQDADMDSKRLIKILIEIQSAKVSDYLTIFAKHGHRRVYEYFKANGVSAEDVAKAYSAMSQDKRTHFEDIVNLLYRRWGTGDAGKHTVAMLITETLKQGKGLDQLGSVFLSKVESGEMRTIIDPTGQKKGGWKVTVTSPEYMNVKKATDEGKKYIPVAPIEELVQKRAPVPKKVNAEVNQTKKEKGPAVEKKPAEEKKMQYVAKKKEETKAPAIAKKAEEKKPPAAKKNEKPKAQEKVKTAVEKRIEFAGKELDFKALYAELDNNDDKEYVDVVKSNAQRLNDAFKEMVEGKLSTDIDKEKARKFGAYFNSLRTEDKENVLSILFPELVNERMIGIRDIITNVADFEKGNYIDDFLRRMNEAPR